MRRVVSLLSLAALVVAAGCSSSPSACSNPVAVTSVAPPQMVSPASGATGVSPNGPTVTISYDPPSGALYVVAPDGTKITASVIAPGTAPAAGSAGAPASTVGQEWLLPQLAAHTTYTVHVSAVYPVAACQTGGYSGPTDFTIGTFTTQ